VVRAVKTATGRTHNDVIAAPLQQEERFGMLLQLTRRILTETDRKVLARFAWNFAVKGAIGMWRFKRRLKSGRNFPPVLFISVTNRCNLRCQGCWASVDGCCASLPPEDLDKIITQSKGSGNRFFGILGGEPLLYPRLWEVLAAHGDCYFQVMTNGTLLSAEHVAQMKKLGNVTPLISIEGLSETSDIRRGGSGVYGRSMNGLDLCRKAGLLTGVATSVCRSNIDELIDEQFVRKLVGSGVHYVWYYIYRPVGPDPCPELALTREQILELRSFIVEIRRRVPILVIDAYWDGKGRALCPAVTGVSHHINPFGDVEPCPPIQFALDSATNGKSVFDAINESSFLRRFRQMAGGATRGCVLMERPDLLRDFAIETAARDTSGRGTALDELRSSQARASHHIPEHEIPESHWFYRLAKKHWFLGFGAYG